MKLFLIASNVKKYQQITLSNAYLFVCFSGQRAVCKSSFKALWNQLLPHIRSCRPRTDLCWQCQQNNEQLVRSANLPEEKKSEVVKKQQDHLALVQNERTMYNQMTAACKKICEDSLLSFGPSPPASKRIRMHYSFDFAQQVLFITWYLSLITHHLN